jgi:hypothetical protein
VSVLVQYCIPNSGNQTKVTEFCKLKGESADVLTMYIMTVLCNYKLLYKIVALCGTSQTLAQLQENEETVFFPN